MIESLLALLLIQFGIIAYLLLETKKMKDSITSLEFDNHSKKNTIIAIIGLVKMAWGKSERTNIQENIFKEIINTIT